MKKSDFVVAVAKEAGITRVEADRVVNAALAIISNTLQAGDKITLTGFGTFEVRERAARAGMNIRTREKIRIPASKRPVFTAGAVLKNSITGKVGAKADGAKKSPARSTSNGKSNGNGATKSGSAQPAQPTASKSSTSSKAPAQSGSRRK